MEVAAETQSIQTKPNPVKVVHYPYSRVQQISSRDLSYIHLEKPLGPFYKYPPTLEGFRMAILDKGKESIDRNRIYEVWSEQYKGKSSSKLTQNNLERIKDSQTFTVVTAHQPSLFTGPLYYIYKIISTIRLSRELKEAFPDNHFVPVFLNSGEDHDFEEVNHLQLFNKTIRWESGEKGSVGNMRTKTLQPVLDELQAILGDREEAKSIFECIKQAFSIEEIYSKGVFNLLHHLFDRFGLIIFNMSDPRIKEIFVPIMEEELLRQPSVELVNQTSDKLNALGYSTQANPREINLFYLSDQIRERIVQREDGSFSVLNTDLHFSEKEILTELRRYPERFSPNVVLRPLFQEKVLPNLAYVGGGGELAYWLERKAQFEYFEINFPVLIRRNSVLWIDKGSSKRMEKLGFQAEDLFEDTEQLVKNYIKTNSEAELSLEAEKKELDVLFQRTAEKAREIDPSLFKAVMAEGARQLKALEQLESKLMRAEKQKHEVAINQIRSLKEKLFPGNGLQERYDNFLMLYLSYGDSILDFLVEILNPLVREMIIIQE